MKFGRRIKTLAMLSPALSLEVGLFFIPLLMLIIISFTEKASFFFTPVYTWINYVDIFNFYGFDFQNTITLVSAAAFVDLIFGYPFAYVMIRKIRRFADLFRSIMLIPLFGELYIAYGLWFVFLPGGPLSFIFDFLNIPISKALYSAPSAIFGLAIYTFPFVVYNVGISLQEIEPSFEEAARCLGAGPVRTFFRITFPLSFPGMLSGWLMSFGWNLGAYAIPQIMGGVVTGQRIISVKVYSTGLVTMNFGLSAALGVVLVVISMIIFYISLKVTRGVLV